MSAFDGTQPQLRQTPPTSSFSTQMTFCLSCPRRIEHTYPPGPPPITTTSQVRFAIEFSRKEDGAPFTTREPPRKAWCSRSCSGAVRGRGRERREERLLLPQVPGRRRVDVLEQAHPRG